MSKDKEATQENPRELEIPSRKDYQPSRAELREEFDMPGADIETVRNAFFRPVEVVNPEEKSD